MAVDDSKRRRHVKKEWANGVWNREHWCVVKAAAASEARTQQDGQAVARRLIRESLLL
jgi:hypothetical protein